MFQNQTTYKSISIFLSALILFFGLGVNIVSFCCNDCRDAGMDAVIKHKCCEIHHHHHANGKITHIDPHNCEAVHFTAHENCSIERVQMDLEHYSAKNTSLKPVVLDADFLTSFASTTLSSLEENIPNTPFIKLSRKQKPPNLSRHVYFDLLTVLII